jgi:carbonic anhydrase
MRRSRPVIRPAACAAALLLAMGLTAAAHASDAPAVAKPSVAPASGTLTPFKSRPAAPAEAARTPATDAARAPQGDEALKRMLAERLSGSGEVVLKSGEQATRPAPTRRRTVAAAATAAASVDAAELAAAHRAAMAAEQMPPWGYTGAGAPERWASLQPSFATCAAGNRQSPIDIRDGIGVQLDPVRFDYLPGGFRVLNNGHTIQATVAPGNTIEVMGRRYELVQFHFHRPSEERVNGRVFDMVAHLVHKDVEGRLAVVAVLLTRGAPQPVVQTVWNNLPLERGEDLAAEVMLDPSKLLPEDRRYYTYMGSLTTPPCTEGVLWMVMKTPVTVSPEQIAIFSRLYPMNARPVQPLNGRLIKESN